MIYHGDLFDVLPTLPEASIEACVTDPPYGLEFMGKGWDAPWKGSGIGGTSELGFGDVAMADGAPRLPRPNYMGGTNASCVNCGGQQRGSDENPRKCRCSDPVFPNVTLPRMEAFEAWSATWAREVFRVLKPGAYLLAFGGPRTFHRLTSGVEDAGFEIRDCLSWLYGSGFPKSLNLPGGRGTALKPSWEPIILARKPLMGTVAANVARFGTGALNIDACRIDADGDSLSGGSVVGSESCSDAWDRPWKHDPEKLKETAARAVVNVAHAESLGRWPANVLLDDDAAALLDAQSGALTSGGTPDFHGANREIYGKHQGAPCEFPRDANTGGASRFYKIASADCALCGLSCVERDTISVCETTPASSAARRSRTIHRIIDATALSPAHAPLAERIVQAAPVVENLCETCVTSIALALVEIRCSGSPQQALRVFPASTPRSKSSILIQRLASFAALWANIDTTPTTPSLSMLFGSVCHAIENCTSPASLVSDSAQPRFLYSAKPSREERDYGTESLTARQRDDSRKAGNPGGDNPRNRGVQPRGNFHPTVKPVELMRWLVRLVTPLGGTVLDPFLGSGTTGMACRYEQRPFIGIEREADYIQIAERRIAAVAPLFAAVDEGRLAQSGQSSEPKIENSRPSSTSPTLPRGVS